MNNEHGSSCPLDEVQIIESLDVLKAVSDPLRMRIISYTRSKPVTVKDLAAVLDVPQTTLYYHVNILETLGLIRVVQTQIVSGIVEKHYQAIAHHLSVSRALLGGGEGDQPVDILLDTIFDESRLEVQRGLREGVIDPSLCSPADGGLFLGREWLHLTPERAQALSDELQECLRRAARESAGDAGDLQTWEVLLGVYPVMRRSPQGDVS